MECKLYKETATSYVYAVNSAFYLVVPKLRIKPVIEVVIDDHIKDKLESYFNTGNITTIRVFAKNYFDDLSDEVSRYKLKSIINRDVSITKQLLGANKIEYEDVIKITTPFENFKEWYINENTRQDTFKRIADSIAVPKYLDQEDNLTESQKRIQELLTLKSSLLNSSDSSMGNKQSKDKVKGLNNGHSLLERRFDDGFVNIIFFSLVIIIVCLTATISMISILVG